MISSRNANWKEHHSSASRSENWKDHYSSLEEGSSNDNSPPIIIETLKEKQPSPKLEKENTRIISKRDMRLLLTVRNIISSHLQREKEKLQATTITITQPSSINPNSIEAFIERVLINSNDAVHINNIITGIEQLGWHTSSTYHKYAEVSRAIRKHNYLFERVGKGKYRMREAFAKRIPLSRPKIKPKPTYSKSITSIKDVIAYVMDRFGTENGLYPALVLSLLHDIGYSCHYSSVYKALQDKKFFVRNGHFYTTTKIDGEIK